MKLLKGLALPLFACAAAFAQNAALMPVPNQSFLDVNGKPLAGGYIYTCVAGSACTTPIVGGAPSNPLATYTSSTGVTQNANPVVLDSGGRASIWLGSSAYKIVVQNYAGVLEWTQDQVSGTGALSAAGTNSASLIQYTPAATGGQTRTLAAIHYDYIDASNYDTLNHAFADACASSPGKLVLIPSTVASGTYTNSCGAFVFDLRIGTSSAPATSRTFTTPLFGGTIYDASPATTNSLAQGDSSYAPINEFRVIETGGANAAALYTEYRAGVGSTGAAYGLAANVSADPGSVPNGVFHNWTWQDATHYWLNGCTRSGGVATCNIATGGSNPAFSLVDSSGANHCFYITGTSDTTFTNSGLLQCPNSVTSSSVTFNNAGSTVSSGVTGGWLSPSHQAFGFELNMNNASHDPGHLLPNGGLPLPVWGFMATPTPFQWTNPTGGGNIYNLPITAAFYAPGGSSLAGGAQYNGFVAADAIDDLFVGGYPQAGGSVSTANSAFRARPIGAASAVGTNYRSQYSAWDSSVNTGSAGSWSETSEYCGFFPLSNSANADSEFSCFQKGWSSNTINFLKQGHIAVDSGTSSLLSYGFNGWSNGIYNNAGTTTAQGAFASTGNTQVGGTLNVIGAYQTNGTAGTTATVACTGGQHLTGITVVNGIVTAVGGCS
jgi:hypothetical protein